MLDATALTERFDRALLYATHVHGGQVRKGTSIPYVAHLLAVAATVIEYGGSEDMSIAALLHDAVEDQGGDTMRVSTIIQAAFEAAVNATPATWKYQDSDKAQRLAAGYTAKYGIEAA
jgi:(p)ppGpp synthase/HD superfamily hydrolase